MTETIPARQMMPPYDEVKRSIVLSVLLTFLTFGIYMLFWQAHQMRCWNQLLGHQKYSFWLWLFLCVVTFGLYHLFHEYVMGQDMVEIQKRLGRTTSNHLPLVSVLLAALAIPFVADAIQQYELHRLYEPQADIVT